MSLKTVLTLYENTTPVYLALLAHQVCLNYT